MFGAALYLLNQLSLGDVSAFVLYSRKFSGPINEMANIISELQSACAAAERVFRLIDEPPEKEDVEGAKVLSNVQGNAVSYTHLILCPVLRSLLHSFRPDDPFKPESHLPNAERCF